MADATGGTTGPAAHADHDPLLVAEAADRAGALPPTLADCPDCRALHADLVALTAAVPTSALPARPRPYTLSQADAERLRAPAAREGSGEPPVERARLTPDMTDLRSPRSVAHADHDPLLVAAAADRGAHLPPTLADCPDCRALHADLVALAAAIPTSAVPARPRTYTLNQADADRLRAPAWRRWLGSIGTSRDAITRPLALGFTTIGLAGLLVATVPGALMSGGATGAADSAPLAPAMAAPAPSEAAATADTSALQFSAAPEIQGGEGGNGVFSGADGSEDGDAATSADPGSRTTNEDATLDAFGLEDDTSGPSTVSLVAGMLLVAGLGLFGLRWSARRLGDR